MAEFVQVDTNGFRTAASSFEKVNDTIESVYKTLHGAAEGKGVCWGTDEIGKKFAEGEKGYLAGRDNLYASLQGNIERIATQTRELRKAAKAFDIADENSTKSFKPH